MTHRTEQTERNAARTERNSAHTYTPAEALLNRLIDHVDDFVRFRVLEDRFEYAADDFESSLGLPPEEAKLLYRIVQNCKYA